MCVPTRVRAHTRTRTCTGAHVHTRHLTEAQVRAAETRPRKDPRLVSVRGAACEARGAHVPRSHWCAAGQTQTCTSKAAALPCPCLSSQTRPQAVTQPASPLWGTTHLATLDLRAKAGRAWQTAPKSAHGGGPSHTPPHQTGWDRHRGCGVTGPRADGPGHHLSLEAVMDLVEEAGCRGGRGRHESLGRQSPGVQSPGPMTSSPSRLSLGHPWGH